MNPTMGLWMAVLQAHAMDEDPTPNTKTQDPHPPPPCEGFFSLLLMTMSSWPAGLVP